MDPPWWEQGGSQQVDVRPPEKANPNSYCARPVHLIITMMQWIRTSRLAIRNFLSGSRGGRGLGADRQISVFRFTWTDPTIPRVCPSIRLGYVHLLGPRIPGVCPSIRLWSDREEWRVSRGGASIRLYLYHISNMSIYSTIFGIKYVHLFDHVCTRCLTRQVSRGARARSVSCSQMKQT